MDTTFKYFEINDINPSPSQVSAKYKERLMGRKPKSPEQEKKKSEKTVNVNFKTVSKFMTECGEKNSWTKARFQKMDALKEDLLSFKSDMKFSDLTEEGLTDFVKYLREDKRLRTPRKKKGDRKGQ